MSTTMIRVDPVAPRRFPRVPTISADLLPEEIVAARRARRARGWVLAILVLVIALLAVWYLYAIRQRNAADEELQVLAAQAASLQRSESTDYLDVVGVQSQITTLDRQLTTVMASDLPWAALLARLNAAAADTGVKLTEITGALALAGTAGAAAPAGTGATLPSTSQDAKVGTLTLNGTAPDKPSIAAFVTMLGTLRSLANPYLTSATKTSNGQLDYSLQVDVTDAALCGRFTTACTTGGK